MGSPAGCPGPAEYSGECTAEPGREPWGAGSEKLHKVNLTHDFEMSITEVTQGEWAAAFDNWNPSGFLLGANYPVEQVSWYDSCAYANWKSEQAGLEPCYLFSEVICEDGTAVGLNHKDCLNESQGGIDTSILALAGGAAKPYECKGFRLPTEAEWEYAARAGTLTAYHNGQQSDGGHLECEVPFHLSDIAWYCGNKDLSHPRVVGGKEANDWGLKDMSGNVLEWCWDKYCADYAGYGDDPDGSSCGGSCRVYHGGSWEDDAKACRSAARHCLWPDGRYHSLGLRLVRTL